MMSTLMHGYLGDQALDFVLVVTLGVALASTTGWVIARRFALNAALRHLVALSALICCLALPALAWLCAAANLKLVSIPVFWAEQREQSVSIQPETNLTRIPRQATRSQPIAMDLPEARAPRVVDEQRDSSVVIARNPSHTTRAPLKPPAQLNHDRAMAPISFRGIATAAIFAWAVGALLMLARLARNCRRVVWLRRSSHPVQNETLCRLWQEVTDQYRPRRPPLLLMSKRTVAPMAAGFGRAAVILPEKLLGAVGDHELRDILVHEVTHLERGDHWIVVLQELAAALYWPIVTVHALNRELERASEELCDNVVLAGRDAIGYGKTLLHVAELLVDSRPMVGAVGILGGRGELERRIAGLIDPRRSIVTAADRKAACIVMMLFIAGGAFATTTRFAPPAATSDKPAPQAQSTAAKVAANTPPLTAGQGDKAKPESNSAKAILLEGKVLGPKDQPIAGAQLFLNVDEWTESTLLGISGADGSYHFVVPNKKLRRTVAAGFQFNDCKASLIVMAGGLGAGWVELPDATGGRYGEMKPEYAHDFRLAPDFLIAGRVVDAKGKPVVGAVVSPDRIFELADPRWRLMHPAIKAGDPDLMTREQTDVNNWFTPLYPTAWKVIPPATTDAQGRFHLVGLGADRAVRLLIRGPGMRSTNVAVITRNDVDDFTQAIRTKYPQTHHERNGYFYPPKKEEQSGDGGVLLFGPSPTIEIDPARTVSGIVRDATTGEPIAGMQVKVADAFGAESAVTDSQGRYRLLRAEDDSSISLYTQADEERYLTVVQRLDKAKELGEIVADLTIPRGVVIEGRVLDAVTNRAIVSGPRQGCHDMVPGPLVAGYVTYYPLANNTALRGKPTGLYFEGLPRGTQNYYRSAVIDGDGHFRLAVPPGPGVLLVQTAPGMPMFAELMEHKESDGLHRLLPYVALAGRAKDDGAPAGDTESLPGFTGPISIAKYQAYRVIDPPADATALDVQFAVPRGATRVLRFVGPDGHAIKGVKVRGLVALPMTIALDGSEAEALGLEQGKPREVIATSADGKLTATATVSTDDPQTKTIELKPAEKMSGGRLDTAIGLALSGTPAE